MNSQERLHVSIAVCGVFETCFSFSSSSCRRSWMQLLACRKAFLWARSVRTRTNTPDRFTPISSTAFATSYKHRKCNGKWEPLWVCVCLSIYTVYIFYIYSAFSTEILCSRKIVWCHKMGLWRGWKKREWEKETRKLNIKRRLKLQEDRTQDRKQQDVHISREGLFSHSAIFSNWSGQQWIQCLSQELWTQGQSITCAYSLTKGMFWGSGRKPEIPEETHRHRKSMWNYTHTVTWAQTITHTITSTHILNSVKGKFSTLK